MWTLETRSGPSWQVMCLAALVCIVVLQVSVVEVPAGFYFSPVPSGSSYAKAGSQPARRKGPNEPPGPGTDLF